MDVQPGILERIPSPDDYLALAQKAVDRAHAQHMLVVFVVVGFRPGLPEVSPANQSFKALGESARAGLVNPRPAILPQDSDVVVVKRRVSAFTGSDLDVILRARDIKHLVLAGIATSGVVLSTLREAADKDFQLTVLADLCADFDTQVHTVLTEKVFPKQATVTTAADWMGSNDHGLDE
jgi:nicotinamidase-related amidase